VPEPAATSPPWPLGLKVSGGAKMTCAVAPDGSVYPCGFLCAPAFLAGNVTAEPFAAIFRFSPVLERFRELEVDTCRTCDRFSVCHGGCPAVACFLTESLDRPDPECLRAVVPVTKAVPVTEAMPVKEAVPVREAIPAQEVA
jgi:radical SAM protein with 4Fe4S-binding SPASM domain